MDMAAFTPSSSVMPFQTTSMEPLFSSMILLSQSMTINSTVTPMLSAKALARSASKPTQVPSAFL